MNQETEFDTQKFGKLVKIWGIIFEKNVSANFQFECNGIDESCFKDYSQDKFKTEDVKTENSREAISKTISQICEDDFKGISEGKKEKDNDFRCRSIISFNLLLIHTYRIFLKETKLEDIDTAIDYKKLLQTINI